MFGSKLSLAVEAFAARTRALTDDQLAADWPEQEEAEVRDAFFRTYEQLRELAGNLAVARAVRGAAITTAQRAMAQYHTGFRDLQAVLLGTPDQLLDTPPAPGEWPVRTIMEHIMRAHVSFWYIMRQGVLSGRAGNQPPPFEEAARNAFMDDVVGGMEPFERAVAGAPGVQPLLDYFSDIYQRTVREIEELTDDDLSFPSRYWQREPYPVRYRIGRFDSHLRQHLIQAEKALAALRGPAPEALRLIRLLYAAQAEVEGWLLGQPHLLEPEQDTLAETLLGRMRSVDTVLGTP